MAGLDQSFGALVDVEEEKKEPKHLDLHKLILWI